MKIIKNTFAILFIALFSLSCSNNDEALVQNQPPATTEYFFRAKINGVDYNHTGITAAARPKTNGGIQIKSQIIGVGSFDFTVDNVRTAGTYPSSSVSGGAFARLNYGNGTGASFSPGSCGTTGQLIITSITQTEVIGTFSVTVTPPSGVCPRPTTVITEGSFKCFYAE
jgi:hypothetical protein